MFTQMLPWLLITMLLGIVIGLIVGTFIASSQARRHYSHFQATQTTQTRPLGGYSKVPGRYLDDDDVYVRRHR